MCSVFKFPIALYFLDQADKRKISLDETLAIRSTRLTIRDLLIAIIQVSDNVACDTLLARIGGPPTVNAYVHSLGITGINIAVTESQMAAKPKTVYDNWCTPATMDTLLQRFYQGHVLSPANTALLLLWMTGVMDARADEKTREGAIAHIARLAYDTSK
jgi:beta-lactamase class A